MVTQKGKEIRSLWDMNRFQQDIGRQEEIEDWQDITEETANQGIFSVAKQ